MTKFLLALSILLTGLMLAPASARAHVLIADDSGSAGAVLHITPDDDPIAGEPASLYFDIRSPDIPIHANSVSLTISDETGQEAAVPIEVPIEVIGNSVSASYTFPTRGVYRIELKSHGLGFVHDQRISRGAAGGALQAPAHEWAEALLVASACGLLVLIVIGWNRRHEIAAYSKF